MAIDKKVVATALISKFTVVLNKVQGEAIRPEAKATNKSRKYLIHLKYSVEDK